MVWFSDVHPLTNTLLWEVQRQRYRTHFQNCVLMIDEESKRYSRNNQKLNPGNKTLYITTQLIHTTLSNTTVGTDMLQWTTISNFLLCYIKVYWQWKGKAKCCSMYWFYVKGILREFTKTAYSRFSFEAIVLEHKAPNSCLEKSENLEYEQISTF